MSPLGLPITNLGALGGVYAMGDTGASVVIEDCFWEIHTTIASSGYLTPLALGAVTDFHDTWDLITLSSVDGNYMPQTTATVSDECYWDIGNAGATTDTDFIRPLDV